MDLQVIVAHRRLYASRKSKDRKLDLLYALYCGRESCIR